MSNKHRAPKVIFVLGTTASGKSDLASKLAYEFNGIVFNCDSIQVYQGLDIGAAKPSLEVRAQVPHRLFDVIPKGGAMTAGEYRKVFFDQIEKEDSSRPIFVVGGTGFYFQAIEKGMFPVGKVDSSLTQEIERELKSHEGELKIYEELLARDPLLRGKIHPGDHYRVARALSIMRVRGCSLTEIQKEFKQMSQAFPYPLLKVGLRWEREELYARVRARVKKMLEMGLLKEVQGLLDEGLGEWRPLQSVGYRESLSFLLCPVDLMKLEEQIVASTMALAKKQRTWFQRDGSIHWFHGLESYENTRVLVENFLRQNQKEI